MKHELLTAADEIKLARQYRLGQHVDTHAKKMTEKLGRDVTSAELGQALEIEEYKVTFLSERGKEAKSSLVRAELKCRKSSSWLV